MNAKAISLTSKLAEFLLESFLRLLSLIPASWIQPLATLLALLGSPFMKKNYRRIANNVALVYGLPAHSDFAKNFQKQVMWHQTVSALESLTAGFQMHRIHFEGLDEYRTAVESAMAAGKGMAVVTGHLGNWELLAYATAEVSGKLLHAPARPTKYEAINRVIYRFRKERLKNEVIWTRDKNVVATLLRTLHEGLPLGFVMDQKSAKRTGIEVDFLGQPTLYVAGPALISIRTGAPILSVFCIRLGPWHYKIITKVLFGSNHGLTSAKHLTQVMAHEIDRTIRLYPEQWAWNYKRW